MDRSSACFTDGRNSALTEHAVSTLVRQRAYAIALDYEDLNDHDSLRHDPVLAAVNGKLAAAAEEATASGQPARRLKKLRYRTLDSWCCERRVVAKAEVTHGAENPRFVLTSLSSERHDARALYEDIYCARGEMENKIRECQLDLFADRTSAATMRANRLRL